MPELPEVETIRRGLMDRVPGHCIEQVIISPCRIFQVSPAILESSLVGQRILGLSRRGKFLVFELDHYFCIFHLGMTGQLTLRDPARADAGKFERHPVTGLQRARQHKPDRHTHLQLELNSGSSLLYRDVRKFGKVYLLSREDKARDKFFKNLGLEPFSDSYAFPAFLEKFKDRKLRAKSLLLDQGFVAGVGNIYADEALFEAGIHPERRIHSLRLYEKKRLFEAIEQVLERGLVFGGTTLRDYINSEGGQGTNQERLLVYGREGEPCRRCGNPVQKIVLSQRGTHFCAHCQPRRGSTRRKPDEEGSSLSG